MFQIPFTKSLNTMLVIAWDFGCTSPALVIWSFLLRKGSLELVYPVREAPTVKSQESSTDFSRIEELKKKYLFDFRQGGTRKFPEKPLPVRTFNDPSP